MPPVGYSLCDVIDMKVTWAGRHVELSTEQTRKLQHEFEKTGKLLDNGKGEAGLHVVLAQERHLHHAEVTSHYHHHDLVGKASDADLFTAIHQAAGKLEAQAIRLKEKWRDAKRGPKTEQSKEVHSEA
jgi:putative sigma-54 modulation protein